MAKIKLYLKSILLPLLVGGVIGFIISKSIDYNALVKPPLAPSSIVFPIVWTIIYILMGISYGRLKVIKLADKTIKFAYYSQLFINALWSIIFFTLKWRLISFIWILLLDGTIINMLYQFFKKDKVSAYLQVPYIIWSSFASYLNLAIYLLN